jgi:hypothetical protein
VAARSLPWKEIRMLPVTHMPRHPRSVACALLLSALAGGCSAADSGPQGVVPGAMALGKFCHELNRSGTPVTLTLQLGDPAITSITAKTSVCAPAAGMPCTIIPMGKVPVKLFEGDHLLTSRTVLLLPQKAGNPTREFVFQAVITDTNQVVVTGGEIATGSCQALDFPPPDGGVTDGGDGGAVDGGAAEGGTPGDAGAPDVPAADDAALPDAAVDAAVSADLGAVAATD